MTSVWKSPKSQIRILLGAAVLVKLVLIVIFYDRVYTDVNIGLKYGQRYLAGIRTETGNPEPLYTKSILGPLIWYSLYSYVGLLGLRVVNLIAFVTLFRLQLRLGAERCSHRAMLAALCLFSFYPGTNLNVVAGEQDDMVMAIFVVAGVIACANSGRPFLAGLLMGVAFVFKYSGAVFILGFLAYLALTRRWRVALGCSLGLSVPFLALNLYDGFWSLSILLKSPGIVHGYSTWDVVGFKLLSTGMLFSLIVSACALWKARTGFHLMLFSVSAIYVVYVVAMGHSWEASHDMMTAILFAGFLIASSPVHLEKWVDRPKWNLLACGMAASAVLAVGISYHNLRGDSEPLRLPSAPHSRGVSG